MKPYWKWMLPLIAAGALLPAPRPGWTQNAPSPLVVGTTQVLTIRRGDRLNNQDWTIRRRINHAHDALAEHLGSRFVRFTTREWGDRVHIYVNGDFLLAVTPADAEATGYKSAKSLAPVWVGRLRTAFERAHAPAATQR